MLCNCVTVRGAKCALCRFVLCNCVTVRGAKCALRRFVLCNCVTVRGAKYRKISRAIGLGLYSSPKFHVEVLSEHPVF
jgi:hypothetical protein